MQTRPSYLARQDLPSLLDTLTAKDYCCVGPVIRDGAIVYDELTDTSDLPWGASVSQAPGSYRLTNEEHSRCFAWANGPQALKPWLFKSREPLWTSSRNANGQLTFQPTMPEVQPLAVIGARACDIAALHLQDQHFMQQAFQDSHYQQRRMALLIIAVNCTHPADTCFCVSTGDGPSASDGYDIALTELEHGYLVETHSEAGKNIVSELPVIDASPEQLLAAEAAVKSAAEQQTRSLPGRNLKAALFDALDHPRWQQVAERCLSCGNCTAVCPSCFCSSQQDEPSLNGEQTSHIRYWDSCFNQGHSYIHGLTIRDDTAKRYRQWLSHKLGSWHDQYGRSGCVGCGRCITWCPVGIDITEEAQLICGEVSS
jgi:sulfhydrogenase subunit beta (sulfur reductase)